MRIRWCCHHNWLDSGLWLWWGRDRGWGGPGPCYPLPGPSLYPECPLPNVTRTRKKVLPKVWPFHCFKSRTCVSICRLKLSSVVFTGGSHAAKTLWHLWCDDTPRAGPTITIIRHLLQTREGLALTAVTSKENEKKRETCFRTKLRFQFHIDMSKILSILSNK